MKISNYAYLCSGRILQMIYNISSDKKIKEISDNYNELLKEYNDIDIKWMLISTALLMSEGLFKNSNVYNCISNKAIDEIEEKLFLFDRLLYGDVAKKSCLLDDDNKVAFPFCDFMSFNNLDTDDYESFENREDLDVSYLKHLREEKEYFNKMKELKSSYVSQGINSSIMSNDIIDVRKLIIMVRNSLAHSSYEIVDNNNVRLYHYNRKDKRLDFNIILDSKTIINILDELNEIAYDKYDNFNNIYLDHGYIDYSLAVKNNASDDDFIDYIMSFDLCDRDSAMIIYNSSINSSLYKTISFDKKYIDDTYNVSMENVNKMAVIVEVIFQYIKPCCDFGSLINDIMYTNKDGSIDSSELYNKYGLYDYLKSDFYGINYKGSNDEEYVNNYLNLLILSFLNCSLLTSHNEYENNNIDYCIFNFSNMMIDENIMNVFLEKHIHSNENIVSHFKKAINDIDDMIQNKNNDIIRKSNLLLSQYRDIKYFNEDIPKEINALSLDINELKANKIELLDRVNMISKDFTKYKYQENLSNFIFKSLRNSLAHGNVKIDINNNDVFGSNILFEDYNPDTKELTFRGEISFGMLVNILTKDNNIKKLYNVEEDVKKQRNL